MTDPTRIDLKELDLIQDPANAHNPLVQRIWGQTRHGGFRIDCPFITEVGPNFWQGGCDGSLVLPTFIKHIVSLYPWERYSIRHEMDTELYVRQYDAVDDDPHDVLKLAHWVQARRATGPVLVHCQAGLNRSGRLAAVVLMLDGLTADEAIATLREKRSPAVLCNPAFDKWLRGLDVHE